MKTAIITGGTRGIGYGIAQCLARDGYNLILGYHTNDEAAQRAKESLEKEYKIQVDCRSGDISLPSTMEKLFEVVTTKYNNELTAFVHNAGLYIGITTATTDLQPKFSDSFDAIFDYYQNVYPRAFKRGVEMAQKCTGLRHVVAISSPGCNCNQTPHPIYEAPGQAKASMEFLVRVHALLLANKGINVNCVIPGIVKTEGWDRLIESQVLTTQAFANLVKNSPAARSADPTEVGEVVAFLCSTKAEFITGTAIPIDGGLHLGTAMKRD